VSAVPTPAPASVAPARVSAGAAPTLAAVVVTYNRLAQLQITLPRLLAEGIARVVVVDNASTDATATWLATQGRPGLTVLRLPENRGGAGGFEAGLAHLLGRDGRAPGAPEAPDWTVLLDDDARPLPGAIAAFHQAAAGLDPDHGPVGVIAAAVLMPDGRVAEMNRPLLNPFWSLGLAWRTFRQGRSAFHLTDAALAPDAPVRLVDGASFVGFFLARGAPARIGLPEGGLFIYGDDVIYSLKLRRAGLAIRLHPAIRFEHDCGTLGTGLATRPLWKVYYLCRNGIRMTRPAAGPLLRPLALAWYLIAWTRKARHYGPAERPVYRRLMWLGIRDGLTGRLGRSAAAHRIAALAETTAKD